MFFHTLNRFIEEAVEGDKVGSTEAHRNDVGG